MEGEQRLWVLASGLVWLGYTSMQKENPAYLDRVVTQTTVPYYGSYHFGQSWPPIKFLSCDQIMT